MLSSSNVARLAPYWTAPTGDSINSTPAVVGKAVFVGSHDSKVYACDIASGNVLWTAATGGSITLSPAVVNGVVYIGSTDNNLYALNADSGQTLWKATAGDVFLFPRRLSTASFISARTITSCMQSMQPQARCCGLFLQAIALLPRLL